MLRSWYNNVAKFTPVMLGTALKNKGVQPLLDAIVDYLPNPPRFRTLQSIKHSGDPEKVLMNPERSDKNPL